MQMTARSCGGVERLTLAASCKLSLIADRLPPPAAGGAAACETPSPSALVSTAAAAAAAAAAACARDTLETMHD